MRIWFQILCIAFFSSISVQSNAQTKEIDYVRDSILKLHHSDDFYFFLRFLPSVRVSTDDFVVTRTNKKWTAKHYKLTFDPPPWIGTNHTPRKSILKVFELKDSALASFLESIDTDRLMSFKNLDSVLLDNSKLLIGTFNYFMIICSKGTVRLIEYPVLEHYDTSRDWKEQNIYWQSNYLDNLIEKIKQAFAK